MIKPLRHLALLPLLAVLAWIPLHAADAAAPAAARGDTQYPDLNWDDLMPRDWDPIRLLGGRDLSRLIDGEAKAERLLEEMRNIWDSAPAVQSLDGRKLRLPGYVVPLETQRGRLREFLLVPYFGACIHSPPPPANQIVYVIADPPAQGVRAMDAVWVRGTLKLERRSNSTGASAYRLLAVGVEPYVRPQK